MRLEVGRFGIEGDGAYLDRIINVHTEIFYYRRLAIAYLLLDVFS